MATDFENARATAMAVQDLNDIAALRHSAAYNRYLERRLNEIADSAAARLLDAKLSPEELKRAQIVALELGKVRHLLRDDEIANRNIAGITGHDPTLPAK